jgi:hypothetical protein
MPRIALFLATATARGDQSPIGDQSSIVDTAAVRDPQRAQGEGELGTG